MAVPELLRRLLTAPGPSGYETAAATVWREAASEFAEVTSDAMGSSVARVAGSGDGPLLALLGHIDEIGLLVTHVDEQGFVYFLTVGGTRPDVLLGQRVELVTRGGSVPGVIGREGGKRPKPGEKPERVELDHLHVDVGARSREEALGLLQIGDVAVIAGEPAELAGGRIASRSLDNRLGAYVALEAARAVAEAGGAPGDVAAVAAVQEEVGDYGGARTTVFALQPHVALAIDVTGATDVPEGDPKTDGEAKLGAGPIDQPRPDHQPDGLRAARRGRRGRGHSAHGRTSPRATRTPTRTPSTRAARGSPTGLVSMPLRYMHSPGEVVSLDDLEAAIRLVAAFARRLEPGLDFTR